MRLKDQVAVVTGAGSGIGRAIALLFAREGAKIVIAELNAARGNETAELVAETGQEALAVATDVGDKQSVAELFQAMQASVRVATTVVSTARH